MPESDAGTENSEPAGPYASVPTYSHPGADYQPPYATQPAFGPTHTPADASDPMRALSPRPTGASYPTASPQYPPTNGAPFEQPVQTRTLDVPQNSRSRARKPLISQEVDAPDPIRRDPRVHHPLFQRSLCTGRRKALCVRLCT